MSFQDSRQLIDMEVRFKSMSDDTKSTQLMSFSHAQFINKVELLSFATTSVGSGVGDGVAVGIGETSETDGSSVPFYIVRNRYVTVLEVI